MNGKIQILSPDISDKGIDHRGAIYSYIPHDKIVEFVYIDTKAGVKRGQHFHSEFDEYILLAHGEGIYLETLDDGSIKKIIFGPGQCIFIPANTPHTFVPLSDCKQVSFLTKCWNDCVDPITPIK
jgi:mannose-6-phosphate isomerase-like protein (cupin superfamily)